MPEDHANSRRAKHGVFLSYARKDGAEFAAALRTRLEKEADDLSLWQDVIRMEGGVGWWKQITEALDSVAVMVLILTPSSVASPVVLKEWRYARQQGARIFPVHGVAGAPIDFNNLPRWMGKTHAYNLADGKEWPSFLNHLRSPGSATRVPFMAPDLPTGFVERPEQFEQLKRHLIEGDHRNPVAITTALLGAGGFGKTTLAAALCHDEEVGAAFDDGILWVTLGEKPGEAGILSALIKLYDALTGDRPGFRDVEHAAQQLATKLEDRTCLIVIDDVWDPADARPFLRGGKSAARLITTRQLEVASASRAKRVDVDEMTTDQSIQMLTARLETPPTDLAPFKALAKRLGEWPLMLELAASALRLRMDRGDSLDGALTYLDRALTRKGVVAFDRDNIAERHASIARTVSVSLELLSEEERQRCLELAIFPEDISIPLATVGQLWRLDEFDTEERVEHLGDLSLLKLDVKAGTIRLHDVMRQYYATQLSKCEPCHVRLLTAWGDPHTLPDDYAWRTYAFHAVQAGAAAPLRDLLLDPNWLEAKLAKTNVNALLADYETWLGTKETEEEASAGLRLIQEAIRLSSHVLARHPGQFENQMLGRMLGLKNSAIGQLLNRIESRPQKPGFRPLAPSLMPPGGPLILTLEGHTGAVSAVAVTHDGLHAISGSYDSTVRIWDIKRHTLCATLEGHTGAVSAVAVTHDGLHAISGSRDKSIRIWDIKRHILCATLEGHTDWVSAVAVTRDGLHAISGSDDNTIRIWDIKRRALCATLEGHTSVVAAVTVTHDGLYAISGSWDNTVRIWDIKRRALCSTLERHTGWVTAVAVTHDGRHAISASYDRTVRIWDIKRHILCATLKVHTRLISAVAVTHDGRQAVSGSDDNTLRTWDLNRRALSATLEGHTSGVTAVAVTHDGRHAISGSSDKTVRIWDLQRHTLCATLEGHTESVRAVAVTHDGRHAISGSSDNTLRVWDLERRSLCATLGGNTSGVTAVAVTHDGRHAISGSYDNTVRIWDLQRHTLCATLEGHTDWVRAVAVTYDGRHAISGSSDNTLRVWDLKRHTLCATLEGHTDSVTAIAVTHDGRHAISASDDNTLKIWDLRRHSLNATLEGHTHWVSAVAVTPDGFHAISGSADNTVRIWDLKRHTLCATLEGHTDSVTAIAVTHDGRQAVSGSWDCTLRIWDLQMGRETAMFLSDSGILSVAVSGDESPLVAGDVHGKVIFLKIHA